MPTQKLALLGALVSLAQAQDTAPDHAGDAVWFEEVALELGVEWQHDAGVQEGRFWFPEIMGGGAALLDYDGDGDLDLYLVQSGRLDAADVTVPTNKLFRNDLSDSGQFVDVTAEAKVGNMGYGMGAACGDFDQDGDVDLYVTNVGPDILYQNDGRGHFKDVSKRYIKPAGEGSWGTSAGFLDADLDGDLDLFLVNNLNWEPAIETPCFNYRSQLDYCSPENYNAHSSDRLYLLGRLGLQDYGARIGLSDSPANGLGLCIADYDRDGDLDVYVANDATPNALWRNDGGKRLGKGSDAKLANVAPRTGCAVNMEGTPEAGMGVQWVDLDQDGWLDLYMTHLRRETNTFYRNKNGRFRDMTRSTGIAAASLKFTGFGMGFHDFDHDGALDLYVANGAVQAWGPDEAFDPDDLYAEPNQLFAGKGGAKFDHLGEGVSAPMIGTSRAAAFGDLDNDGDVDAVVVDRNAQVKILRNIAPKKGSWVGLRLLNKKGSDALGALVELTTWADEADEHVAHWRLAHPTYSYLASNDPRVHIGIPEGHKVGGLRVIWPGSTELVDAERPKLGEYSVIQQD
jgi:hypothetical protein